MIGREHFIFEPANETRMIKKIKQSTAEIKKLLVCNELL